MIFKYIFLVFFALCAGGLTAAGFFAFISTIGLISTFAKRTHTGSHIARYEDAVMIGAIIGNTWWTLSIGINFGSLLLNNIVLGFLGIFYGIFTGSMIVAIAETIKAIPVFFRRAGITVGMTVMVIVFAMGKTVGSILYTIFDMAAK